MQVKKSIFFKILDDLEQIGGPVWVQFDTNWTPVARSFYIFFLIFIDFFKIFKDFFKKFKGFFKIFIDFFKIFIDFRQNGGPVSVQFRFSVGSVWSNWTGWFSFI